MLSLRTARTSTLAIGVVVLAAIPLATRRTSGLSLAASRREPTSISVTAATFEPGETWQVAVGGGSVSTEQAHGGTKSAKLISPAGDLYRFPIDPDLNLSGVSAITLWTYGVLSAGLPGTGNNIDFKIAFFDSTLLKSAAKVITGIITENTTNDVWVERTIAVASMTVDAGFNWAAIDEITINLQGNVTTRVKTLYVDDIVATAIYSRPLRTRRVSTLALGTVRT